MSTTRGGPNKRKAFAWTFDARSRVLSIENREGRVLTYSLRQVQVILDTLWNYFGRDLFPLANNVARLGKGSEKPGLGMVILETIPGDVSRAQGASYLGVVLEECGFLEWNGESKGVAWRLLETDFSPDTLARRLTDRQRPEG